MYDVDDFRFFSQLQVRKHFNQLWFFKPNGVFPAPLSTMPVAPYTCDTLERYLLWQGLWRFVNQCYIISDGYPIALTQSNLPNEMMAPYSTLTSMFYANNDLYGTLFFTRFTRCAHRIIELAWLEQLAYVLKFVSYPKATHATITNDYPTSGTIYVQRQAGDPLESVTTLAPGGTYNFEAQGYYPAEVYIDLDVAAFFAANDAA